MGPHQAFPESSMVRNKEVEKLVDDDVIPQLWFQADQFEIKVQMAAGRARGPFVAQRLPRHHRDDDLQVPRYAGGLEQALEHLRHDLRARPDQTHADVRLPRGTKTSSRWPRRIRGFGPGRFCVRRGWAWVRPFMVLRPSPKFGDY